MQLVVGFPPGGGVDIVARQLAEKLSDVLGQRIVVENKAGAAGNVAMEYVARAKPDGYTLLMGNLGMLSANPALYKNLTFDPAKDFVPIARVVVTPLVAVVPGGAAGEDAWRTSSRSPRRSPASSTSARAATATSTTWPASCSRCRRARRSSTSRTRAARRRCLTSSPAASS